MFSLTDGTNTTSFYPLADKYSRPDHIIASEHETRDGSYYSYTWATVKEWAFDVAYVNSAFMSRINAWWSARTILSFTPDQTTDVFTVMLVGKNIPVDAYVKPYNNLFEGTIKLREV